MNHYYTMTAAVVPIVDVHSTGVFGHRVVRHEPPLITVPFILNMKEDIKYCVAAFRQLNNVSSFWGILARHPTMLGASAGETAIAREGGLKTPTASLMR